MVDTKVTVKDLGFAKVMKRLQDVGGLYITVGVHGDSTPREGGGPTMVQVATWNEFGTSTIPERSFIRSTIDARRGQIGRFLETRMRELTAVKRRESARQIAELVGTFTAAAMKKTLTALKDPPNAPSTVDRKGSSNPLIDTGQLRTAITHKVIMGRPPTGSGGQG